MSCSRRTAFSEGNGPVSVDLGLETHATRRLLDHINFAAKDRGYTALKLIKAAEIVQATP
ncbi:MAG TPA: hypothetical protein VK789_08695 [Bryobacteraceae bacterium]|nr:hypothetical protein [Bryobacteraceae bacterium]